MFKIFRKRTKLSIIGGKKAELVSSTTLAKRKGVQFPTALNKAETLKEKLDRQNKELDNLLSNS